MCVCVCVCVCVRACVCVPLPHLSHPLPLLRQCYSTVRPGTISPGPKVRDRGVPHTMYMRGEGGVGGREGVVLPGGLCSSNSQPKRPQHNYRLSTAPTDVGTLHTQTHTHTHTLTFTLKTSVSKDRLHRGTSLVRAMSFATCRDVM